MIPYADYTPLTFHDAARRFTDGNDSPRAYLERCLETIAEREPVVKALTALNETGARAAADASAARCKAGRPLSPIDGMPVGIKELLEPKVSLLWKLRAAHESKPSPGMRTIARIYGLIPQREIYTDTCNKQSVRQVLACGMCLDGCVQKK